MPFELAFIVSSPSSQSAGQTSPSWAATYWKALRMRSASVAERPT